MKFLQGYVKPNEKILVSYHTGQGINQECLNIFVSFEYAQTLLTRKLHGLKRQVRIGLIKKFSCDFEENLEIIFVGKNRLLI